MNDRRSYSFDAILVAIRRTSMQTAAGPESEEKGKNEWRDRCLHASAACEIGRAPRAKERLKRTLY